MSKLARQILTTRGVAAFWLLWCAAFVLMLWAVSPGRTLQDALAAELLQGHLAGGYQLRNPPLYEWLLWAMQELVGSGPLSYLMLRYALIAATGILFYVALRRTVASQRLAAAFSLSLVLLYWFGWEIHHSVSHSLALLAASLALFIAALIYAERPTPMRALLLGLIIGIGLMAKWSFLLVVLSLGLALAITPETRRIYRDPQTLIVLVSAALPIVPFLLWLDSVDPGLVGSRAVPQGSGLSAARALQGALVFADAAGRRGDQARRSHGNRDPRGHGRAPAGGDCDRSRAVRHHALRHPLSLSVLPVRGVGARRPCSAARQRGAVCAEARHYLARLRPRHFPAQAWQLLCHSAGIRGDEPASLRQAGETCFPTTGWRKSSRDAASAKRSS
jgi:hypothetical protein